MTEFEPSRHGPDELFLSGRLQLETAITLLEMTGINLQATDTLKAVRDAHELTSHSTAQNDLHAFLKGGVTEAMKADIIVSAQLTIDNPGISSEIRLAAAELLDILA